MKDVKCICEPPVVAENRRALVGSLSRSLRSRLEDRFGDDALQFAVRLAILGFLIYWCYVLVRPFIPILVWSIVLAAALYPFYDWLSRQLHGHRKLAAGCTTLLSLLVVVGPVTWLGLGAIEGLRVAAEMLSSGTAVIPPPPDAVKAWPLVGPQIHDLWDLASTNLSDAFRKVAPQVRPYAGSVVSMTGSAVLGMTMFIASVIVAGFLFLPGPRLVEAIRTVLLHIAPERSDEFVAITGATIRSVSRGVIGIAVLQALLVGIGLSIAGVPHASLLTFLVLALGVLQIGSTILIVPVVVWCWTWMDTMTAVLFTAYMLPASILDNILKPLVMARGLKTPTLVIFVGVIGGTLAHGPIGLFIGPIVLAVGWELLRAWMRTTPADERPHTRDA